LKLYHSTTQQAAEKIVKLQSIYPTKFNFEGYMDVVLDNIDIYPDYYDLPTRVQGMRQVPFLGNGIYCFDNPKSATEYIIDGSVIILDITEMTSELDIDAPETQLFLMDFLDVGFKRYIIQRMFDEELKLSYELLRRKLINFLIFDKGTKAESVCYAIIIFLLVNFYEKSFGEPLQASLIGHDFIDGDTVGKYYVLREITLISKITLLV